eukprot:SAG11_NODE_771_length_7253_cov_2.635741_9_plen_84_part_00
MGERARHNGGEGALLLEYRLSLFLSVVQMSRRINLGPTYPIFLRLRACFAGPQTVTAFPLFGRIKNLRVLNLASAAVHVHSGL